MFVPVVDRNRILGIADNLRAMARRAPPDEAQLLVSSADALVLMRAHLVRAKRCLEQQEARARFSTPAGPLHPRTAPATPLERP